MLCGLVEIIIQKAQGVSLGISVLRSLRLLRIFKVTRYNKDTRAGQLRLEDHKNLTLYWIALLALNCYSYGSSKDHLVLIQCSFCIFIIRVRSAFSLVMSCVLLKYTRTNDVNWWRDLILLIYFAGLRMTFAKFIIT